MTTKQAERAEKRKAAELMRKIKCTASYIVQLMAAGWERGDAIDNAKNLFHLSKNNMSKAVELV